ncbi:MAG: segregation/condensation protein A [Candidatus Aenigmatarchaeota archaeon]
MTEEENILQLVLEKENWEEIIYHIVSIEKLDPWNIDLIKLTDSFLNYLKKIEELDFRIPARVVFVAAVLLRLKADYLSIFEEEETIEQIAQQQPVDLGIDPNLVQLGIPIRRIPKRQITLDELILALRKAMAVRERRIERSRRWRERIELQITEEDITKRIEEMMREIDELMKKMKSEKVGFSQIVKKWERKRIVEKFVPLLHLENDKKIETEQEDYFKEIWIRKIEENKS